ncbi:MAG: dipeptidase, partial [Desulfovibrionales bacterium]|nr:dipeptidase [Desulfovibrionales bacterium]
EGLKMTNGFPLIGKVPGIKQILDVIGMQPEYDESRLHCNQYGLTDLGKHLINRMIDKNMLIELDHTSYNSSDEILKIAEARDYAGVTTVHSHLSKGYNQSVSSLHRRIADLGGYLASYNFDTNTLNRVLEDMLNVAAQSPYQVGVGFSTDVNGLANQADVRDDIADSPVQYPFTSYDGRYTFEKQKTGNRVFDYNKDGVAHYGLLADHLEDIRNTANPLVYESIMNSAEAYLQMWERAENNTSTGHVMP